MHVNRSTLCDVIKLHNMWLFHITWFLSIVLTGCGYGFGKFGAKNIDAKVRKVRNVNTGTKNRIHLAGRLEKSKFGASLVNPLAHWKSKPAINFFLCWQSNCQIKFYGGIKGTHSLNSKLWWYSSSQLSSYRICSRCNSLLGNLKRVCGLLLDVATL